MAPTVGTRTRKPRPMTERANIRTIQDRGFFMESDRLKTTLKPLPCTLTAAPYYSHNRTNCKSLFWNQHGIGGHPADFLRRRMFQCTMLCRIAARPKALPQPL